MIPPWRLAFYYLQVRNPKEKLLLFLSLFSNTGTIFCHILDFFCQKPDLGVLLFLMNCSVWLEIVRLYFLYSFPATVYQKSGYIVLYSCLFYLRKVYHKTVPVSRENISKNKVCFWARWRPLDDYIFLLRILTFFHFNGSFCCLSHHFSNE